MSAPPPPSYSESMAQQGPPGYHPPQGYGATAPPPPGPMGTFPPPQAGYPPAGGYDPSKAGGYYPQQGGYANQGLMHPSSAAGSYQSSQNIIVQSPQQQVVLVGGCPACRVGILEDDFTCLGVLCAIVFFPLGVLCCLAMRQRRCTHCAAVFG